MNETLEIIPSEFPGLRDALLLDVREPFELEICHLPGSLHIPLGQLKARLDEVPRDRTVVVLCHHGVRSLHATSFLRHAGFAHAVNLAGGIDRWAREMDPGMKRY